MSNLHPKLSPSLQSGFAAVPILVLLLIGIVTGTLLVQNRTNFLPKATQRTCTTEETQACSKRGLICKASDTTLWCADAYNYACGVARDGSAAIGLVKDDASTELKYYCPNGCEINPISQSFACKSDQTTPCSLTGFKDSSGNVLDKLAYGADTTGCDSAGNKVNYACLGENNGLIPTVLERNSSDCPQPAPAQAACTDNVFIQGSTRNNCTQQGRICSAQGTDNGCPKPTSQADCDGVIYFKNYGFVFNSKSGLCQLPDGILSTSGTCSTGGASQCTNGKTCKDLPCPADNSKQCYICIGSAAAPVQGAPVALSSSQLQKCSDDDLKKCPTPNKGCYILQGAKRCVYEKVTCNQDDINYCNKPPREDCGTTDITIDGQPFQHTQCVPAKSGTSATGGPTAGAPATGTTTRQNAIQNTTTTGPKPASGPEVPRAGQNPPAAATAPQPAAPLICGKDKDGLDIPCYSIGVFSKEELTSREAQAKIATVNYESFRKILKDQEAQIGKTVAENAEKKIKESETAMKACMQ